MKEYNLEKANLKELSKGELIRIIKKMYKDNKDSERTLSMMFEDYENLSLAFDKACEILSHDLQKIDINGDEKLVLEKAEKWKEFFLNYEDND